MRSILRSPAPILLLILAIAMGASAYSIASQPLPRSLRPWLDVGTFASLALATVLFVTASRQLSSNRRKPFDERASLRRMNNELLGRTFVIAALVLFLDSGSPEAGLVIGAVAAAWIVLWSIPRLRRTETISSVSVNCRPEVVFAFVSDLRNLPRCFPDVESVELITTEPIGAGSRFRVRTRVFRQHVASEGVDEIVDYEPGRRFTARTVDGLQPNLDEYIFDPVGDATRMTHRFDFESSFSSAALGGRFRQPATNRLILARRRAGEARIKQILESAPL